MEGILEGFNNDNRVYQEMQKPRNDQDIDKLTNEMQRMALMIQRMERNNEESR